MHKEKILVLDFGSQYTQLIARRVRENRVYSEILPFNAPIDKVKEFNPKGIILSGGPSSIYDPGAPFPDRKIFELGVPVLGICYGMQLMAYIFGGRVTRSKKREYGRAILRIDDKKDILKDIPQKGVVWMSHGDRILRCPAGFRPIAHTDNSPIAAVADRKRGFFALQFHPEVVHTEHGFKLLRNFIFRVCTCKPEWTMKSFIDTTVKEIREKVGRNGVVCAISGGVDSAVTAVLMYRAVKKQLTCIFVDNGVLRTGEASKVEKTLRKHFHMNIICVDASKRFLKKLKGITDPERKRKIIGNEFIKVFEEQAKKIRGVKFLAQGTLYPDVIESTS
jgi:GMP synthase (glutamine-hydrolysing)